MSATLEALRAAGILSPLDEHFARAMGRIAGDQRPEVLLAAALASRQVGNGHVCLDLARLVTGPPLVNEAGEPLDAPPLADARSVARRAARESAGGRRPEHDAIGARCRGAPLSAALLAARAAAGGSDSAARGRRRRQR